MNGRSMRTPENVFTILAILLVIILAIFPYATFLCHFLFITAIVSLSRVRLPGLNDAAKESNAVPSHRCHPFHRRAAFDTAISARQIPTTFDNIYRRAIHAHWRCRYG